MHSLQVTSSRKKPDPQYAALSSKIRSSSRCSSSHPTSSAVFIAKDVLLSFVVGVVKFSEGVVCVTSLITLLIFLLDGASVASSATLLLL